MCRSPSWKGSSARAQHGTTMDLGPGPRGGVGGGMRRGGPRADAGGRGGREQRVGGRRLAPGLGPQQQGRRGRPSTQDFAVAAGQSGGVCLDPTFDFTPLYALRDTTPGRFEASLTDLASGRELGAAMRPFAIVAHNEVAWAAAGASIGDMDDL